MDKEHSWLQANTEPTQSEQLAEILAHISARLEAGDAIDWDHIYSRYPQYAKELDEIRPAMDALQNIRLSDNGSQGLPSRGLGMETSRNLGDFRILREIGRGGMGLVYEAEQISIRRRVALKILPLAELIDVKALARFKNEVTAIATLEHPNIVSVYSIGEEKGIHYYAMKLIRGQSLAAVVRELQNRTHKNESVTGDSINQVISDLQSSFDAQDSSQKSDHYQLDKTMAPATVVQGQTGTVKVIDPNYFRNIVRLILPVTEALQHAHEHGIVHRDIKPGNLLLDKSGRLYVADFGLARIETGAGVTMTGDVVGTLRYMSPEQLLAGRVLIDHRTDIYSLGATLYELLTLQPMWSGSKRTDLIRHVSFEEPVRPRKINQLIPADLETIVLKAISKNPSERYDSAQFMADDLQSFLDNKPILARPPNLGQRVAKWTRRNPKVMWTSLVSLLILTIFFGFSSLAISKARDRAEEQRAQKEIERKEAEIQRQVAVDERNMARQNQYYAEMVLGQTQVDADNPGGLYTDLLNYLPLPEEEDIRGWEWYYLMSQCRPEERTITDPGFAPFAAWSPDGKYIGAPGSIWKAQTGTCIHRSNPSFGKRYGAAWSPDGQKFAWGMSANDCGVYIWDRANDRVDRLTRHASSVWSLDWSRDGSQIVTGSLDNTIKCWSVEDGNFEWSIVRTVGMKSLDRSPLGNQLAVGYGAAQGFEIWDIERRQLVKGIPTPGLDKNEYRDHFVSWHPNGTKLAVSAGIGWWIYETKEWKMVKAVSLPRCDAIAFSPDGALVAVANGEQVTVYRSNGENEVANLTGHRYPVKSVSWHPDSRQLVSADEVKEIKLWNLDRLAPRPIDCGIKLEAIGWLTNNETLTAVARDRFSSLVWLNQDGTVGEREALAVATAETASADRKLAADYYWLKHAVSICDASSGANRSNIKVANGRWFHSATLSRDGSRIVVQSESATTRYVEAWDVDQEKLLSTWESKRRGRYAKGPLRHLTWNSNNTRFAGIGSGDFGDNGATYWLDHLHVFDVDKQKRLAKHRPTGATILSACWDPSDRMIAIGSADGRLEVVDVESTERVFSKKSNREGISAIDWQPSGYRLAIGTTEGEVQIVSGERGRSLLKFAPFDAAVTSLAWSHDGQRLAAATFNGEIQTWDASRAYQLTNNLDRRGELAWMYHDRSRLGSPKIDKESLQQFLRHAPDQRGFWLDRGNAYAEMGEFESAVDEYNKSIGPDLQYSYRAALYRAYALLGSGRLEEYQQACADLVEVFKNNPIPPNRLYVQWLASLTPNPLINTGEVNGMFLTGNNSQSLARLMSAGAIFRDGEFGQASQILTELAEQLELDGDWTTDYEVACAKYFLSIIRADADQPFQAERLLKEANKHSDSFVSRASDKNWIRFVALKALRNEATAKIGD